MDVVVTPWAGWAVPTKTARACRVTPAPRGRQVDGRLEGQECGPLTRDWWALSDWWRAAGVPHVALESPGESWNPVDHVLAGDVTVFRVTAAPGPTVPGRQAARAAARCSTGGTAGCRPAVCRPWSSALGGT